MRVVSIGASEGHYSTELCGGTHVTRTGDIGLFKIIGETAVAAGVRRIEALTGAAAMAYFDALEGALNETAELLKASPSDVPARVEALIEERRKLERDLVDIRRKMATGGGEDMANNIEYVGDIKFVPKSFEGIPAKDLKNLADDLKKQIGSGVVALVSNANEKASLVVGVTEDLTARLNAVDLVRVGSVALGGKGGGGRPDMAQAGGPNGKDGQVALNAIKAALSVENN